MDNDKYKIGDKPALKHECVEAACGDHPAFLMGRKGEVVEIVDIDPDRAYPFVVKGPTNPGKEWRASAEDFV